MMLMQKTLKRSFTLFVCSLICSILSLIGLIIYNNGIRNSNTINTIKKYDSHYYVLPSDLKVPTEKIILLWTPIQGNYKEWEWGIGPDPVIGDCNNPKIDGKCLITTHVALLNQADVVLFSIQDIKQVCIYNRSTITRMHTYKQSVSL